jgi:demethylmenaquinone methyltransferase / 2-methoxy-6-polyprenyl-1,4-benzoquinol methylase
MKTQQKNRERFVSKVFQDVFDKYDLMNDIMSLGIHRLWKKQFINWLNPQINTKLLDVASGTGDIAKLYLDKLNNNGHVSCLDENQGMLNLSKKRFNPSLNIKWICCDAEKLPFKNNYFDYYTISFGIRNINDMNISLKEAYRVLKPGGRFLCLEFSKIENNILNKFYQNYSKAIPKIGKLVMGKEEPYEYLVNSIKKFCNQDEFVDRIKKQNFENVTYRKLSGGIVALHSAWKT